MDTFLAAVQAPQKVGNSCKPGTWNVRRMAQRRAVSLCIPFRQKTFCEGAATVSVSRGESREGEIAIPLACVSFRFTFLHAQKSEGALPFRGGRREWGIEY